MNEHDGRKVIPLDEAMETLLEEYRMRLEADPELTASEWLEHVGQVAEVEWRGDECVLLVDE